MLQLHALALVALVLTGGLAHAQTYRWADPKTGRTIVSDQPPPPGIKARQKGGVQPLSEGGNADNLPYGTRMAAREFPVMLFTAEKCGQECAQARQLLVGRGIPFAETLVASREQVEALKQMSGQEAVPVLRVGQQVSVGFNTGTWNNLLDLAGYPASAPVGYRPPAAPVTPAAPPPEASPAQ